MSTSPSTTAPDSSTLNLAPSTPHQRLLDQMPQSLAYDGGDVLNWQRKLRAKLAELVGQVPTKAESPNLRSLWKRQFAQGTVEKIAFTSEPGCDVLAYVCLPHHVQPPYRFVIGVQGHSPGMHISLGVEMDDEWTALETVDGDRDFAITAMERGLAMLCIEQRAFGQRAEPEGPRKKSNKCWHASLTALLLGRTMIGERVHDVDCGIDYLQARGDVDMSQLAIMGNSGGGTTSLFCAALLDRIQLAMPSCYFCTFRDSIASMIHCMDNYIPGIYQYAEMADLMGLFAPKPVVIVAGKEDDIFPIEGTYKEFQRLQGIYEAAGAPDNCRLVVGDGGHRFYAQPGWSALLDLMSD